MVNLNYYNWTNVYVENDFIWLENILPLEETGSFIFSEIFLLDFLYNTAFLASYYFTNSFSFLSTLDLIILNDFNVNNNSTLYKNLLVDYYQSIYNFFFNLNYFFFLDYKNYLVLYFYFNPELVIAFFDYYYLTIESFSFDNKASSVTDIFINKFDNNFLEFLTYFKWLILSIFFVFFTSNIVRINKITTSLNFYFNRLFYYSYSFFRESRVQFELGIQLVSFILFFWIFLLMSYNDNQVESIELLHLLVFYFFLFLILTLLVKYSVHYFSFLEASVIEGKNSSFIAKQFVRDMSNTFALFLRFFLLLFRLNIYDGLDDFLDSYYIFFCDFDDDTYYDELLVLFDSNLFFYSDNANDANLFNDTETDLLEDIYQKYYITWGKFFMFWAFILEEAFRVSLALYICYLIIFEVHSINCSYSEDIFFNKKKI